MCNDEDDDCDGEIDEDFPSKGGTCFDAGVGECRGEGVFVCRLDGAGTECMITDPGAASTTEVCNGLDDDCDTYIDEGDVCVGCSGVELCNNLDDDCDDQIDEDLTRDCGTDVGECTAGTETCVMGTWQGCDATGPFTEVCDALDNDCNGTVNGFSEDCLSPSNPGIGECRPGRRGCPSNATTFGACLGEVLPTTELCDTLDNDCDGAFDEDTGGADCSSACGVGTTVCVGGVLSCDAVVAGSDDTCDGVDDDCDMMIDEDAPPGAPCDDGGTVCMGMEVCQGGAYVCLGEPIRPETCDCRDNNCDGNVDENNGNCPSGSTCTDCQCAFPCAPGEFPCPEGKVCNTATNFCVNDRCFGVTCAPGPGGELTTCDGATGECVELCDAITCAAGFVCYGPTAQCEPDTCATFPDRCGDGELCRGGECVVDQCAEVTCQSDQYCLAGACIASCAGVDCPTGERCRLGACEPDPCGAPCPAGQVCDDAVGECKPNPCNGNLCAPTEACDPQTGVCRARPVRRRGVPRRG
ncbi:MAG: MopE-related protein [Kofleriaceae bacterium]